MKVILISKVVNYGNIGDVVEVKDGYARNFLIPKGKAIHFSQANYKAFEDQKKEFEAKNQDQLKKANEIKKLIGGKDVIVIENASDDGRLYGAVNSTIIANKVNEIAGDVEITRSEVTIEKPIKETGVYDVLVELYGDVSAKLRLIVSRNESEIDTVIKQAKAKAIETKSKKEEKKSIAKTEDDESEKANYVAEVANKEAAVAETA